MRRTKPQPELRIETERLMLRPIVEGDDLVAEINDYDVAKMTARIPHPYAMSNARARRVIEKCAFQFRGSGMVRLPGRGAFPIERFALDRRTWSSLKSWGAPDRNGSTGDAPRETAA